MPKFIIVGAGAGGLFSARALVKAGIPAGNITLLEKESVVGGKCHTFKDPDNIGLKTEYGATLVAHNYGVVLDTIFEKIKYNADRYQESLKTYQLETECRGFMKDFF